MKSINLLVLAALIAAAPPQSAAAEEVPFGNWTGFAVRLDNNNQNRQQRVLVVKKVPDPHAVWRGGNGELVTIGFGANQNNLSDVSVITLGEGRLTFSYTTGTQLTASCVLLYQQKDNNYVGDCTGDAGRDWRVTLNPPPPPAPKPAEAKPAEAK